MALQVLDRLSLVSRLRRSQWTRPKIIQHSIRHDDCRRPLCSFWHQHSSSFSSESSSRQPLVLYDSLSTSYKVIPDSVDKGFGWYTCGPTTYAPAHLGHARTYVCLDIIRRVLERFASEVEMPPPLFVMNITDVDDKILAASLETGESPVTLARRFEKDFWRDMDALNCLRPHVVTRVTEHVETALIPYIQRLVDRQMAYESQDGVYFDLRAFEDKAGHMTRYGKLAPDSSNNNDDENEENSKKRDPRDFVLWKRRKDGEELFWDSPWGEGRPGWHIECSAMIQAMQDLFQDTHSFFFHAGGVDLKFPHHSNEIAQAEAYDLERTKEREWIPHWVHTGHLHIEGMKMSKSLKNFVTIEEMLADSGEGLNSPADDFRLWCLGLAGSYRGPATYSMDRLAEARTTRQKIVRLLMDASDWIKESGDAPKNWSADERDLLMNATASRERAIAALTGGMASPDLPGSRTHDLDGATFLREILSFADRVNSYIARFQAGTRPIEPVLAAMDVLRDLLSLVGFSAKTVSAGAFREEGTNILGGERALCDEVVKFRAAVRAIALDGIAGESTVAKEILRLCDDVRDRSFPSIGLEVLDAKHAKDEEQGDWRFCVPQQQSFSPNDKTLPQTKQEAASIDIHNVPLQDLFRVGLYEGMFSQFDRHGVPLANADGSEVSKTLMKKLYKKREKHAKRLASSKGC